MKIDPSVLKNIADDLDGVLELYADVLAQEGVIFKHIEIARDKAMLRFREVTEHADEVAPTP